MQIHYAAQRKYQSKSTIQWHKDPRSLPVRCQVWPKMSSETQLVENTRRDVLTVIESSSRSRLTSSGSSRDDDELRFLFGEKNIGKKCTYTVCTFPHKQINCFTNQKMCFTESSAQQFLKGTQSNVDYVRKMVQNLPLSISHIKFRRFRVLQFLKVGLRLRQTFVSMSNRLCKLQDGQQAENLVTQQCILPNRKFDVVCSLLDSDGEEVDLLL